MGNKVQTILTTVGLVAAGVVIFPFNPVLGATLAWAGAANAFRASFQALGIGLADRRSQRMANPISSTAPLPFVYGTDRIGVAIAELRAHPSERDVLYLVGALCVGSEGGAGIENVTAIYLEDRLAVNNPDTTGAIGTTGVQSAFSGKLQYAVHLGTNAQTHNTALNTVFPTEWPVTADARGIAYIVLRLEYDKDVFPTGLPNITAVVKGQKVYDPRDASTTWKTNPALCVRDFLTSVKYGCAVAASEIDDASFQDAANYCDEVINTTAYNGVRFTCNGTVNSEQPRQQVLSELLSACRGELVYQSGKFRIIIRKPTVATTFKLNEDNIVGDWEFLRAGGEVPNSITAAFMDPAKEYQVREVTWPEAGQANGFLTADNNIVSHASIQLPYTTNFYIAQQLGMVTLREAREDITIAVTVKEEALKLQVGDVVPLTHSTPGFTDKEFWVAAIGILPNTDIRLVLREYDAAAYTLDTQNTDATVPGGDLADPFTCQPPSGLTLLSNSTTALDTQEGGVVPRIKVTWTASPEPFLDQYQLEFKLTSDSLWAPQPPPQRDATLAFIWPVTLLAVYDVRLRAVNRLGVASVWVSASVTVTTKASANKPKVIGLPGNLPEVTVVGDNATGVASLRVNRFDVAAQYAIKYKFSKTELADPQPSDAGVTTRIFSPTETLVTISFSGGSEILSAGPPPETAYIYVWGYGPPAPGIGGSPLGSQSQRVLRSWQRAAPSTTIPKVTITAEHAENGLVNFVAAISDPGNLGGTFKCWTAPDSAFTSPNPAGAPDATLTIPAPTPYVVRSSEMPAMRVPFGHKFGKTCWFEFVASDAESSGQVPHKLQPTVVSPTPGIDIDVNAGIGDTTTARRDPTTGLIVSGDQHGPRMLREVTQGGVLEQSRQYNGNLFGQIFNGPQQAVVARLTDDLRVGDVWSLSADLDPSNAADSWRLRATLLDDDGTVLASHTSDTLTGTTDITSCSIVNKTVPANAVMLVLGYEAVGSPVGIALMTKCILVRGPLAPIHNIAPIEATVRNIGFEATRQGMQQDREHAATSGTQTGASGQEVVTASVMDAARLQTIVDTVLRQIMNSQLVRNSMTIDDAIGILRTIENTRDSQIAALNQAVLALQAQIEYLARSGVATGVTGSEVVSASIVDSANLNTLIDTVLRQVKNSQLVRGSMSIDDALGILRTIENTRDSLLAAFANATLAYQMSAEDGARSGTQTGANGQGVIAATVMDSANLNTLVDAVTRELKNVLYRDMTDPVSQDFHAVRREYMARALFFSV